MVVRNRKRRARRPETWLHVPIPGIEVVWEKVRKEGLGRVLCAIERSRVSLETYLTTSGFHLPL
jgi:hypothetical protein